MNFKYLNILAKLYTHAYTHKTIPLSLYIYIEREFIHIIGLPGGSGVKDPPTNVRDTRDLGLIPGSERFPGEGNSYPFQYSCLKNSTDQGAWWVIVHGVAIQTRQ